MNTLRSAPGLVAIALLLASLPLHAQDSAVRKIIDFSESEVGNWYRVHDRVMGGRSTGGLSATPGGFAAFEGDLSLENNGGFASVRTEIVEGAMAGASAVWLRVRGDGQRYQLRLRTTLQSDGVAYGAGFDTLEGEWSTVAVPIAAFEPTFRGYRPRGVSPLDPAEVRQLGIMLTDKQEGPFALEIAWIGIETGT